MCKTNKVLLLTAKLSLYFCFFDKKIVWSKLDKNLNVCGFFTEISIISNSYKFIVFECPTADVTIQKQYTEMQIFIMNCTGDDINDWYNNTKNDFIIQI